MVDSSGVDIKAIITIKPTANLLVSADLAKYGTLQLVIRRTR